jgi:hypothetical protein
MSNLDKSIAEALAEEPEIGEFGDEQNILAQVTSTFRSKNRWMVVLSIVFVLGFMGIGVYSLLQFLELKDTPQALPWAVLLIFSLMSIVAMKIWYWMELNKNAVLREIVRLERRIEQLHEALSER